MSSLPPPTPTPTAPRATPARALERWFDRTPFGLKFAFVGLVLAGPLLVAAGYGLAQFHARVQTLGAVERALLRADDIRVLTEQLARHRGLTATLLAGGEDVSAALVAEQTQLLPQLDRVIGGLQQAEVQQVGLPDAAALRTEVHALTRLPDARDPAHNFERHNAVVSQLLAVSARLGHGFELPIERAAVHEAAFVQLPSLIEELGRERGWGSAMLTLRQLSAEGQERYLLYAGAVARRLELLRADPATLLRLDQLHGGSGWPLPAALEAAAAFHRSSLALLAAPPRDAGAGRRHFAAGTAAIREVSQVNQRLVSVLREEAARRLAAAERWRAGALAFLLAVLLLLGHVYREFARSTVQRLRALRDATARLPDSRFDERIVVEGADEIAELGASLERARQLLRTAIDERARGLAAREADRAKTDFLARWSHDLRTPLNAVLGFAELLGSRPDASLSAAQRDDLQRIRQAGAHLLRLVNDVLDISRIEASRLELDRQPLAADALVDEALDLVAAAARSADVALIHHLAVDAAGRPPGVLADRTRLLQVLVNLLGNAVKFNRRGGSVQVRVLPGSETLAFEIADTGPGISPEGLARLFAPFERLDAAERHIEGSGLGLALSQRLAALMDGRIEVTSTPGRGSVFTLSLPAAELAAAAPLSPASRPAAAPAMRGRVAYVEDDPVNALLVGEMLRCSPGVVLSVFRDGAEALAAVAAGRVFELWLVDKQLPDIDGVELLARLRRASTAPVHAVMLSADALSGSAEKALAAGFAEYWTKPIALGTLSNGLARQLGAAAAAAGAA